MNKIQRKIERGIKRAKIPVKKRNKEYNSVNPIIRLKAYINRKKQSQSKVVLFVRF